LQGDDAQGLVLMPGSMNTVDVLAQTAGDFLLRCRVSQHLASGMQALLHVQPAGGALPLPSSLEPLRSIPLPLRDVWGFMKAEAAWGWKHCVCPAPAPECHPLRGLMPCCGPAAVCGLDAEQT
jgi:hypothetical protein